VCELSVQAVVDVWQMFQTEFLQLWDQHSHEGDAYPAALFGGSVKQGQQAHQACLLALKILLSTTLDLYTSSSPHGLWCTRLQMPFQQLSSFTL